MTALDDLQRIRIRDRVSLGELSARTGDARSNLSALLNGRRDPRLSTVEKVARGLRSVVVALPVGGRETVSALSTRIAGRLQDGDASGAYRSWIQIADDLTAEPITRLILAAQEPESVDPHWDAAVAGVVEWRLEQAGLPLPRWVAERRGDPADRWRPPAEFVSPRLPDPQDVPEPLRRRGVWIDAAELESA